MKQRTRILQLVGTLILTVSSVAAAQPGPIRRWGRPTPPPSGACFFEHANFQGRSFCLRVGESEGRLPPELNRNISSIQLIGRSEVIAFAGPNFRGPSGRFDTDVRNLRREGWNDLIASVQVNNASFNWDPRPPTWGNPSLPSDGACFYRDANFRGQYFCMPRGASYPDLPRGMTNEITAIRIFRSTAIVFDQRSFRGRSLRVTSDVRQLNRDWNDRISSIRIF